MRSMKRVMLVLGFGCFALAAAPVVFAEHVYSDDSYADDNTGGYCDDVVEDDAGYGIPASADDYSYRGDDAYGDYSDDVDTGGYADDDQGYSSGYASSGYSDSGYASNSYYPDNYSGGYSTGYDRQSRRGDGNAAAGIALALGVAALIVSDHHGHDRGYHHNNYGYGYGGYAGYSGYGGRNHGRGHGYQDNHRGGRGRHGDRH
jgi:hypothetical protein